MRPTAPVVALVVTCALALGAAPGAAAADVVRRDPPAAYLTGLGATRASVATPSTTVTATRSELSTVAVSASDGDTTVTGSVPQGTGPFSLTLDLAALDDGSVTVRAVPTGANGPGEPASVTTRKDTVAPTVTGLRGTRVSVAQPGTTVIGTRSESSSVALSATDGTHTVTGAVATGTGDFAATLDLSTLDDGAVIVRALATDTTGNPGPTATAATAKDATRPTVGALTATTQTVTSPTTVTGTRSEPSSLALVATDGAGRTVAGTVPLGAGGFTKVLDLGALADGPVTVAATPVDAAGNVGPSVTTIATKDRTAPTVSALAASATNRSTQTTTVTGTRSETSTLRISAGDGTRTVTASVPAGAGGFTTVLDLTALDDGTVTVRAVATDAVGNVGPASVTTAPRDATPPGVTTLAASGTSRTTRATRITGFRTESATVTLTVGDGTRSVTTTLPAGRSFFDVPLDVSSLADGLLSVTAAATDAAGNRGAPATTTLTKDTTAPRLAGLAASAPTSSRPVSTITGTRSEAATVALSISDGRRTVRGTVHAGTGRFSLGLDTSSLGGGTLTVTAVPTDAAGNTGGAVLTTTRRSDPPGATVSLAAAPALLVRGASLTLSGRVTRRRGGTPLTAVRLQVRDDTGRVSLLRRVAVGPAGSFSYSFTPSTNGSYTATYVGDVRNEPGRSPARRTLVATRIAVMSPTGPAATRAVVQGTVSPRKPGVRLVLYRLGSGRPVRLGRTTVRRDGTYRFRVALPRGRTRLLVRIPATVGNAAGSVILAATRT